MRGRQEILRIFPIREMKELGWSDWKSRSEGYITSELAFSKRPLLAHSSSDETDDNASFEAPGQIVNMIQSTEDRHVTQLEHILINKSLQLVLHPAP